MCSSENITYTYELEVLKNLNDIGVNGKLYEENNILTIRGSFAYANSFLTLQSNDLVQRPIHGKNFTDVELDVYLRSSIFMEGYILFKTAAGNKYSCMTELRRNAGKSIFVHDTHPLQKEKLSANCLQAPLYGQLKFESDINI